MQLALAIYSAPEQGASAWSAYRFALAALEAGHDIYRVFFYHDGVYHGANNHITAQDEQSLPDCWQQLAKEHQLDLVVCISAARRRGVFNAAEGTREGHSNNLLDTFDLSGLGQYTDALLKADRMITFGPPA